MKTKMQMQPKDPICLDDCMYPVVEKAVDSIRAAWMKSLIQAITATGTDHAYAEFGLTTEDGQDLDSDILRVHLAIGLEECEPTWNVSLRDCVTQTVDWYSDDEGKVSDEPDVVMVKKLRDMFQELADKLNQALPEGDMKP